MQPLFVHIDGRAVLYRDRQCWVLARDVVPRSQREDHSSAPWSGSNVFGWTSVGRDWAMVLPRTKNSGVPGTAAARGGESVSKETAPSLGVDDGVVIDPQAKVEVSSGRIVEKDVKAVKNAIDDSQWMWKAEHLATYGAEEFAPHFSICAFDAAELGLEDGKHAARILTEVPNLHTRLTRAQLRAILRAGGKDPRFLDNGALLTKNGDDKNEEPFHWYSDQQHEGFGFAGFIIRALPHLKRFDALQISVEEAEHLVRKLGRGRKIAPDMVKRYRKLAKIVLPGAEFGGVLVRELAEREFLQAEFWDYEHGSPRGWYPDALAGEADRVFEIRKRYWETEKEEVAEEERQLRFKHLQGP